MARAAIRRVDLPLKTRMAASRRAMPAIPPEMGKDAVFTSLTAELSELENTDLASASDEACEWVSGRMFHIRAALEKLREADPE